jgi:hypothetical protein
LSECAARIRGSIAAGPDGVEFGHDGGDRRLVFGLPGGDVRLGDVRRPGEEVHGLEEDVDVRGPDGERPALGLDEAIFQRVSDPDRGVEADDPRGPLERVGGAHQGFEDGRGSVGGLDVEKPFREEGRLALRFGAEQLHH